MVNAGSLLAFGDSLSDMGNAKASILNTPDVPPYWQGRFSNGEVWLGGLYDAYGLTSSIGQHSNQRGEPSLWWSANRFRLRLFAHSERRHANFQLFGQCPSHDTQQRRQPLAGGNDFLYGTANADTIAANMEAHIRQLAGAGRCTLVFTAPGGHAGDTKPLSLPTDNDTKRGH